MREDRLTRDICRLLATEREAVLDGAYDRLAALSARKEVLFGQIESARLGPGELNRIGSDVTRNQRLLQAASAGIADATVRLSDVRSAREGFQAYGREGQRETVTSARPTIERKA